MYHIPPKLSNKWEKETNQRANNYFGKSPAYTYSAQVEQVAPGNVGKEGEAKILQWLHLASPATSPAGGAEKL